MTLIIGYGNPLREDDGVAWHVAERIRTYEHGHGAKVITCHQLTPELADAMSRVALVIFIDARLGAEPGGVKTEPILAVESEASSSHDLSPARLLRLTHEIYGAIPTAWGVTVTGAAFGFGTELSPVVESAIEVAARRVEHILATARTSKTGSGEA